MMPLQVSAVEFEVLVAQAIDTLPAWVLEQMDNVSVHTALWPSAHQRQRARAQGLLLGLYEGVPLNRRGRGYHLAPPDRITLFRGALLMVTSSREELTARIQRTITHEIGHHFGMTEQELRDLGI